MLEHWIFSYASLMFVGSEIKRVSPGIEGLLLSMEVSQDARYILACTNNSQIVLVDNSSNRVLRINNPFTDETVVGMKFKEDGFIVFGRSTCVFYSLEAEETDREHYKHFQLISIKLWLSYL